LRGFEHEVWIVSDCVPEPLTSNFVLALSSPSTWVKVTRSSSLMPLLGLAVTLSASFVTWIETGLVPGSPAQKSLSPWPFCGGSGQPPPR
jgi:hypothetical protein